MKNKSGYIYLIVLIIPVSLIIISNLFTEARTPYYLLGNYDPSYVYLLNSLNIAQFTSPGYIEHPGTPLHVIGAVVMKIYFTFAGKSGDLVTDVFERPETYLRAINFTMILLNAFALFMLGIVTYKLYQSIPMAVFLQLTPVYSIVIFQRLSTVTAENLLIFLIIIFIIISLKFINENTLSQKIIFAYTAGFAIITGAGIATKIIFFPFLIIPLLLLKKISNKVLYIIFTFISFIFFVLPAISYYKFFTRWIKSLFIHDKMYGKGDRSVIDWTYFTANVKSIFINEKYFAIVYLIIIAGLVGLFIYSKKNRINGTNIFEKIKPEIKLLTGIFLLITVQIIIVAKHYAIHYMLPAFMLLVLAIFLIIIITNKLFPEKFKIIKLNTLFIILTMSIIIIKIPNMMYMYSGLKIERTESIKVTEFINDKYPDKPVISGMYIWNKEAALNFAMPWTGYQSGKYKKTIDGLRPNHLFYDNENEKIYCASDTSKNFIKEVFSKNNRLILVSNKYTPVEKIMKEIKEVYNYGNSEYINVYKNGEGAEIYEIKLKE